MRIAAGVILIIVAVVLLVGMIIDVNGQILDMGFRSGRLSIILATVPMPIILGSLLVAGGVLCFRRRHWGVCLVSAVITLAFWIIPSVAVLTAGGLSLGWRYCITVVGTVIATIFISFRKREWQEISDSMDGKVSHDG
jgi:hypothetical protein